jgi:translocation and assembly module TamA
MCPLLLWAGKINYSAEFLGLSNKEALKTLKRVSALVQLEDKSPESINALSYRAESDIPELIKALHSYGYYEAEVRIELEEQKREVLVFVLIAPGPQYVLSDYAIHLKPDEAQTHLPGDVFSFKNLKLTPGMPALGTKIVEAEQYALALLSDYGYPLASVASREMVANGKTKSFSVTLEVQAGPFSLFGLSEIRGQMEVKKTFIERKLSWKENDPYCASLVEKTQTKLMDTGLFTSVLITHPPELNNHGNLPMTLEVLENKHKSVNGGISYQTFFGPGITFGWENRNIGGMGRRLNLQADATRRTHSGGLTFLVPDFYRLEQDYVAGAQAMNESIFPYHDRSYALINRVEQRIDTRYRLSCGVKLERLFVTKSVANGTFTLLEVPLYFRWSTANNLLDPTRGNTLEYKAIPSTNFSSLSQYYISQTLTYTTYTPFREGKFFVLAQKLLVESILSKDLSAIPLPKRVLEGTDQEMRGYRYKSVSPLRDGKPLGGRSGIFYTIETRFRLNKMVGLVPFFDIGNVCLTEIPQRKGKWFKSTGLGVRYFSFLGPLRFDVAVPLDRRQGIDPRYRVLVSMGQTF